MNTLEYQVFNSDGKITTKRILITPAMEQRIARRMEQSPEACHPKAKLAAIAKQSTSKTIQGTHDDYLRIFGILEAGGMSSSIESLLEMQKRFGWGIEQVEAIATQAVKTTKQRRNQG